jgi:hypothetical protein
MNLHHSMRHKAAKSSQTLWWIVRYNAWDVGDRLPLEGMPALDQACVNAMALGEKPSDFPSPAIGSSENAEICRLSRNPEGRLTVKFLSKRPKKILPSDLPSKRFARGNRYR